MKRQIGTLLTIAVLVATWSGCGTSETTPDYLSWSKATAESNEGRSGDVDVCQARGWYGDSECDTFCPAPDTEDCPLPGGSCQADTDCQANQFCDLSECLSCCPDAPPGSSCIAACCGVCREETSVYDPCMSDSDCASGEVCDRTECLSCCPGSPPGSDCIAACCGECIPGLQKPCTSDGDCTFGMEWCIGGECLPCDNGGLYCDLACPNGFVDPINGCQPCQCKPDYTACTDDAQCAQGEACDMSQCLSCCPDAPPGTACIDLCCGACVSGQDKPCTSDDDCTFGMEWCIGGECLPCDNGGLYCDLACEHGFVDPINGCQPCRCKADYVPCLDSSQCGIDQSCDTSVCLSCCPDAPPGTACIDMCCGQCA